MGMTTSEELAELRRRFARDMQVGVRELAALGYNASIFAHMLQVHTADEAARRLVLDPKPSEGLWRLQLMRRLDRSVEMWVLLPEYRELFDDSVREAAEKKLRLLDVDVRAELERLVRQRETE